MHNKKFDLFSRLEELPSRLYVILAIFMLAVHTLLCTYTDIKPVISGIIVLLLYLGISLCIYLIARRRMNLYQIESDASEAQNSSVIHTFKNRLSIPYTVIDTKGQTVTLNLAMRRAVGLKGSAFQTNISDLCGLSIENIEVLEKQKDAETVEPDAHAHAAQRVNEKDPSKIFAFIGDRKYRPECHMIHSKGKVYHMVLLNDVTELDVLTTLHHDEHSVIGYIVLDNLEEIAQYVKVSYQAEAIRVGNILKEWASSVGAIIREYDRNKYVLVMSRKVLNTCIKNKFEILDTVREVHIGDDNMPVTVSMGIATTGENLSQRERDALVCLDNALQRGGDQVVLKLDTGIHYFGGRTKTQQKRTRGHSRIIATKLCSMISSASNVIVMGHANPDFDSIGACVGIASLALHLGVDVKIVADTESENFKACTGRLCELADYKNIFVDGVVGLGESAFGSLLIIVDANNFKILEAPEIAANSFKTVVIDHHIKKSDFEQEPNLVYIDPSASSTCEQVAEILEQSLPAGVLRTEEANVMMAGIMVDTNNFTRSVGTRTFAAALYLRDAGASTEYARTFFEEAFEDYTSEARFGTEAHIYRDQIAITSTVSNGSANSRVAAAKAADKLLTVRNVNAAFALILIGDTVHVSARSNGTVNVQLILEKIGGGGHFDVAGAAIKETTLELAEEMLQKAIDEYFEDISKAKN